jgi:hypothetical protein
MKKEDSLQFAQDRLRTTRSPLRLRGRERILRRVAVELPRGTARRFDRVDGAVMVRSATGLLWCTQAGDPQDVMLSREETCRAEREEALHVFALQQCLLEIDFDDEELG